MNSTFRKHLQGRISTLFLNTMFITPNFIKNELVKHLELPKENITLSKPTIDGDTQTMALSITFEDSKEEFGLVFSKRIEPSTEATVPKMVKKKRKWYQLGDEETELVFEKKMTKEQPYWLLTEIK